MSGVPEKSLWPRNMAGLLNGQNKPEEAEEWRARLSKEKAVTE